MATVIIWLLIIISLAVIGFILFRKFTVLANIDIANIEAEKQAAVKEKIIAEKFQRQLKHWFNRLNRLFRPSFKVINNFGNWLYRCLLNWKKKYSQNDLPKIALADEQLVGLFAQAQDLWRREDLNGAENKYIEIIGLDSQNFKAFHLLGELYLAKENYEEAQQTLEHAVKLKQTRGQTVKDLELGNIYYNLSLAHQAQNDYEQAIASLKQARQNEPNNPRYLDKLIELCFLIKDKGEAYDACKKLEEVNPDNQKLPEFKRKIMEM